MHDVGDVSGDHADVLGWRLRRMHVGVFGLRQVSHDTRMRPNRRVRRMRSNQRWRLGQLRLREHARDTLLRSERYVRGVPHRERLCTASLR